jgi:hypothetical protein
MPERAATRSAYSLKTPPSSFSPIRSTMRSPAMEEMEDAARREEMEEPEGEGEPEWAIRWLLATVATVGPDPRQ